MGNPVVSLLLIYRPFNMFSYHIINIDYVNFPRKKCQYTDGSKRDIQNCNLSNNIKREYRAIPSCRHLVYFEFWAKVYSETGIIESIHSRFGANMEGDEGEIMCFPLFLRQRTHFRAKSYLSTFREKLPHILLYYIWIYGQ